jgi:hypothetical protein
MSDLRDRLAVAIEEAKRDAEFQPFGMIDGFCGIWVADIYQKVFQCDPAKPYRGRFTNLFEANELMGKRGIIGVVTDTVKRMGWHRIKPKAAKVGDLAIVRTAAGGDAIAIFDGWLFVGLIEGGYAGHPTARRVWSVA